MTDLPKVVAVGGGTGLASILRSLKNYPISLSAIVTMTDNGASSGRLSRELGVQPPGDVRKCLAALARDEQLLTKLFEYRFQTGRGINGHSLGNLLLIALTQITGSFESAVEASSKILSIKGQVIPSTLEHVSLLAELNNGQMALGEVDIPVGGHRFGIKKVSLAPHDTPANPMALHFINHADVILIGPGSMYTSIIPNFLIKDLRKAISNSSARKYYICNTSTERGETEKMGVEEHLQLLRKYLNGTELTGVIVNNHIVSRSSEEGKLGNVKNITTDKTIIDKVPVVLADLVDDKQPLFHSPRKLGEQIWQLITS